MLTPDPHTVAAEDRLGAANSPLAVSDFVTAEVYATLAIKGRRRELLPAQVDLAADRYLQFTRVGAVCHPLHAADGATAAAFVRQFSLKLRAPDALHLAICQRLGAALLTFDETQAAAAAALGLPLA